MLLLFLWLRTLYLKTLIAGFKLWTSKILLLLKKCSPVKASVSLIASSIQFRISLSVTVSPIGIFDLGEYLDSYELSVFLMDLSIMEELIFDSILGILYYFIFESLTFRSLGKYVTKTKVIMNNGAEPTPKDILIRSFCRIIPFDALSFLGTKGQGWHDQISKTYVVDIAKFEEGRILATELEQTGRSIE